MRVLMEQHIEQVLDGSHYKGHVKIEDTALDYELVFRVPIPKLCKMRVTKDDIYRLFQLTIKRGDANIELTKEEYAFFFSLTFELAVELYGNEMTSHGLYELSPELCEMLSTPKFGCDLVA